MTDEPQAKPKKAKAPRRATAESMAARQREISVSEFFTKNRHLLGFDNPAKALLTTVKEAVDNSLDACEEAGILPDLSIEIEETGTDRFRVSVQDNGPGIVRAQVPKIFAKLLYGSKFHRLRQSRGQQGIGISAAGMYGQLTTGHPILITTRTGKGRPAAYYELRIDTQHNKPEVLVEKEVEWEAAHGTRVSIDLTGTYRGGARSVDAYVEQTAIANPHTTIRYVAPKAEPVVYERTTEELPREPAEIKPHPYGVELGILLKMLQEAKGRTLAGTLSADFSRVSAKVAAEICAKAGVSVRARPSGLRGEEVERIHKAMSEVKILAPPASCVVPIGEELVRKGLERRYKADFFTSSTRPPAVYRGNPFVVEVGIAFGGELPAEETADVMRFANRVPLQYQPGACAITEAVQDTNWKAYALQQPRGSLPIGPLGVFIHVASVWVPFTSESKEAVAHYPEIIKEMKLGLQECGRRLGTFLRARDHADYERKRFGIFELYLPEVARSLGLLTGASTDRLEKDLRKLAGKSTGLEGVDEAPEAPAKKLKESEASYGNGPGNGDADADPEPAAKSAGAKGKAAEQLGLDGIAPTPRSRKDKRSDR